jgi:hypothetical protein
LPRRIKALKSFAAFTEPPLSCSTEIDPISI